ncbi:SETMR methyltransferase, partial [Acromyrmex insinuator]
MEKEQYRQDNAPAHSSAVATAKLVYELRYELLPHPPYSPDLAPCDFFLFPNKNGRSVGKSVSS